jgi:hypothetical protein
MRLSGAAQDQPTVPHEATAATVRRSHRPQSERVQPRRPAHGRPRIGVAALQSIALESGVDEERTVGGEIALLREDSASEPRSFGEDVPIGVPQRELRPIGRTPSDHDGDVCFARHDHEETRRRHDY